MGGWGWAGPLEVQLTFVIEPVDSVNTGAFVVASQQKEVFWVLDFVCEQETNGLQGLLASIHVVPKKQII